MLKRFIVVFLTLAAAVGLAAAGRAGEEVCRIRIHNDVGGLVQVSVDRGRTYGAVGRVTIPANARILGFAAASYTPSGTVAATAVHGLRIKTGQYALGVGKEQRPMMFSVCPLEYARIPPGYGGHRPRSSAIHTDIYAGHAIFRNLAPFVGSPVFVERDRELQPIPEDYTPLEGETFVIVVERPDKPPTEVEFENKAGGRVIAKYADSTEQVIAEVIRPVRGVGRYDGTTFTGVGSINTNHGGVITMSTAPVQPSGTREGEGAETRGGFMIQPAYHVAEQGETSPQVMVIGSKGESKPRLEGSAPLFSGNINLARFPEHPENSCRVEVKIDDANWEQAPEMVGKADDAFTAARLRDYFSNRGKTRRIRTGVTAIRLLLPDYDPALVREDLARETDSYAARTLKSGVKPVKGTVGLAPGRAARGQYMVNYYVDGNLICTSNEDPHTCEWDTTKTLNGLHYLEIESMFAPGAEPLVETRQMLAMN